MCEFAERGNLVYHGHAGHELLPGVQHVLKVRLVAPLDYRVQVVMERDKLERRGATRYIAQVDEERASRMRYLFRVDWRDPQLYDLVLSLNRLTLDSAAALVIRAVRWPAFQPTEASRAALTDLALSSRIRATLAVDPRTTALEINVHVADRIVTLSGAVSSEEAMRDVLARVETVSGIKQLKQDLTR